MASMMATQLAKHTSKKHICCIIPPALLLDIIENKKASEGTQIAVQNTYNHVCKLQQKRKHRNASIMSAAPGASPAAAATPGQSRSHHSIIPSYVFEDIAESSDASPEQQVSAQHNIKITQNIHATRIATDGKPDAPKAGVYRKIYDSKKTATLRSKLIFEEGGNSKALKADTGAQEILDFFGKTWQFYDEVFKRNSIDDKNLELIGSLHYDDEPGPPGMDNAFWDGDEMAFGDGDGEIFGSFTKNIDVIGHELTHGVVQYTANLEYEFQSGALNESMADVFGTMIKQYFYPSGKQKAEDADWLIGEGIFLPAITNAKALRSMKAPGTAYNNPKVGKDRQGADMDAYAKMPNTDAGDYGGVHINSGIPNRAFYLASVAIGGYSWEKAGKIWYAALSDESLRGINTSKAFTIFADLTVKYAKSLFDEDTAAKVKQAWTDVKVYKGTAAPEPPKDDL